MVEGDVELAVHCVVDDQALKMVKVQVHILIGR